MDLGFREGLLIGLAIWPALVFLGVVTGRWLRASSENQLQRRSNGSGRWEPQFDRALDEVNRRKVR
jgi:hypothetical protein